MPIHRMTELIQKLEANNFSMLPKAHACTAGLKALTTSAAVDNVEECRKLVVAMVTCLAVDLLSYITYMLLFSLLVFMKDITLFYLSTYTCFKISHEDHFSVTDWEKA